MKAATDVASGGVGSFNTSFLGMTAAGPSAGMRPRVTDGGGGKAGNDDGDVGEGAEQATLLSCGKRTAVEEADGYRAESATSRVGECFGTRLPETFYEDFARLLEACEIKLDDEEETSGGAATLHTSFLGMTAAGPSAGVRPRVTDGGGGKAGDGSYEDDRRGQREHPSTPGPETSAVARGCGRKTGEKGGGCEEAGPEKGAHGKEAGPGMGTYGRTGGKAGSRKEGAGEPTRSEVRKLTRTEVGTDRIPRPGRESNGLDRARLRRRVGQSGTRSVGTDPDGG
jgi:hypothetical protein